MKITIVKIVVLLLTVIIVTVAYLWNSYIHSVNIDERVVSIIVEPGDNFQAVADEILSAGVVKSRLMLLYPAQWREIDKKLVPGRYDFTGKNSCRSVLDKLERADFLKIKVTVTEGLPIWKVAAILKEKLALDSARLIALNRDSSFLDDMKLPCLEGYLFPETYFIPWGMSLEEVIKEMVTMFRVQTDSIWADTIYNNLSREDVVILASIVEAETRLDREKNTVASVYHNRIKKKMKLDADPTVIYGLGGLDRPLMRSDLKKDTPYNTYRLKGLPPTPINSPDLASIRAVLNPDSTDYYFFVADGTGGHRFSRTNLEHNQARLEIKHTLKNKENINPN